MVWRPITEVTVETAIFADDPAPDPVSVVSDLWAHQRYCLTEVPRLIEAGCRRLLVTSPTGGGKSRMITGLVQWALERGWGAVLYTNRRLLITQLGRVFRAQGIDFGVRAAGNDDERHIKVQISSLPTEQKRVLKYKRWSLHGSMMPGKCLAIVDEAHINGGDTARKILRQHLAHKHITVGFTATPIGLGHLYDDLVVAGTTSSLRQQGILVPAWHYSPDEPDMQGFRTNQKTGEYRQGDVVKAIMHKAVFGRVLTWYRRLNPWGHPTLCFAPGVRESIWFARRFTEEGIRAAHIDGEGLWVDGTYTRKKNRDDIIGCLKRGEIKVLCNRFVLREGLDIPEVSHLILATVMATVGSYLQAVGRGLRASPGKARLIIQDHGGHAWRHGSVNVDRVWNLQHTERILHGLREDAMNGQSAEGGGDPEAPPPEREPICCPNCCMERRKGPICPGCGHESQKSARWVLQTDGQLIEQEGPRRSPKRIKLRPDTERLWIRTYYRARNSRNRMTFRQALALFCYEQGYYPPRTLKLMPRMDLDFFLPVCEVPSGRLQ